MFKFEKVSRFSNVEIAPPVRKTEFSGGYDMVAAEDIIIQPMSKLSNILATAIVNAKVGPEFNDTIEKIEQTQGSIGVENFIDSMCTLTLDELGEFTKRTGCKPTLVSTGYKASMPDNYTLDLYIRSSCPLKYWIILANSVGVIDKDYYNNPDNEGEIFFQVINLSNFPIKIKKGDIIGQAKFIPFSVVVNDNEQEKAKRLGGFGSTTEC